MNPLEERVERLEKRVEQLEAQLAARDTSSGSDVSRPMNRHPRRSALDPELAIRRARQQNSLWLVQGMRVIGFTLLLCFLCWGGVVIFEQAQDYLDHRSHTVFLNTADAQP